MNKAFSTRPDFSSTLLLLALTCGVILISITGNAEGRARFPISKVPPGLFPTIKKFFTNPEAVFSCMEKKTSVTPELTLKAKTVIGRHGLIEKGASMSDAEWKVSLKELEKDPEVNEIFEVGMSKVIDFLQCTKDLKTRTK